MNNTIQNEHVVVKKKHTKAIVISVLIGLLAAVGAGFYLGMLFQKNYFAILLDVNRNMIPLIIIAALVVLVIVIALILYFVIKHFVKKSREEKELASENVHSN